MNHDATHCADYSNYCPKTCYRGQLTKEYLQRRMELHYLPVSWVHYLGTNQCERKQQKDMLFASIDEIIDMTE